MRHMCFSKCIDLGEITSLLHTIFQTMSKVQRYIVMFFSLFTAISDANNVYDIGETGSVPCRFSNMREAFKKK